MEAAGTTRFRGLAIAVAFGLSAPLVAQVADRTEEDPALQVIATEYYAKNHRVSATEATRRIRLQDRSSGIADDVARLLGTQYAGIWYDAADQGLLKVGLTPAGSKSTNEVQTLLERYGVLAESRLLAVRFSEQDLELRRDAVEELVRPLMAAGRAQVGYSTAINSVTLTVVSPLTDAEEAVVRQGSLLDGVVVRRAATSSLLGRLFACDPTGCDPPFRGGREIRVQAASCTAGFVARHRPTHQLVAMTAGHCLSGVPNATPVFAPTESGQALQLGVSFGFIFPGRDAGVVALDPVGFWAVPAPVPHVIVRASIRPVAITTENNNYPIRRDGRSSIGEVKCMTGRTTFTHCGTVEELGATSTAMPPGGGLPVTVKNLGMLSACAATFGDSGAPVYKRHAAFGLLTAGRASTCNEFYQGIREAQNLLNVSLVFAPTP